MNKKRYIRKIGLGICATTAALK